MYYTSKVTQFEATNNLIIIDFKAKIYTKFSNKLKYIK